MPIHVPKYGEGCGGGALKQNPWRTSSCAMAAHRDSLLCLHADSKHLGGEDIIVQASRHLDVIGSSSTPLTTISIRIGHVDYDYYGAYYQHGFKGVALGKSQARDKFESVGYCQTQE